MSVSVSHSSTLQLLFHQGLSTSGTYRKLFPDICFSQSIHLKSAWNQPTGSHTKCRQYHRSSHREQARDSEYAAEIEWPSRFQSNQPRCILPSMVVLHRLEDPRIPSRGLAFQNQMDVRKEDFE